MRRQLPILLVLLSLTLAACGDDTLPEDEGLLTPDNPVQARWNNQSVNNAYDDRENNGVNNGVNNGANNGTNNGANNGTNNGTNNGANNGANNGTNNGTNNGASCGGVIETEAFRLLNEDRIDNGLLPLQCHNELLEVARNHCEDMAVRQYFAHINPDGDSPFDRMRNYGVTGWTAAGENIAFGYNTPSSVQEAWMNSEGHRRNILTPHFTHAAVGIFDDNGQIFWTQLFATF